MDNKIRKKYKKVFHNYLKAVAYNLIDSIGVEKDFISKNVKEQEKDSQEIIDSINEMSDFAKTMEIKLSDLDEYNKELKRLTKIRNKISKLEKMRLSADKIRKHIEETYKYEIKKKQ